MEDHSNRGGHRGGYRGGHRGGHRGNFTPRQHQQQEQGQKEVVIVHNANPRDISYFKRKPRHLYLSKNARSIDLHFMGIKGTMSFQYVFVDKKDPSKGKNIVLRYDGHWNNFHGCLNVNYETNITWKVDGNRHLDYFTSSFDAKLDGDGYSLYILQTTSMTDAQIAEIWDSIEYEIQLKYYKIRGKCS